MSARDGSKQGSGVTRRGFLGTACAGAGAMALSAAAGESDNVKRPNVVYVFGDQWRAQATGYAGDPNARTPELDRLESESINFTHAISGCPVCTPHRASLLTGQYWLTHGTFMNDLYLSAEATSVAEAFLAAGYDTGYIGKWHVDGHGRTDFTPVGRRQGFGYWKTLECTHNYNKSLYYEDTDDKKYWDGYDASAQTRDAQQYIRDHAGSGPFFLMMSWGPPHAPYQTAPEEYRAMYDPADIVLRPNVPEEHAAKAREELAGYYAHIAALDDCIGSLTRTLEETGIADDTIFVFTSDHGDMLHSHGFVKKQQPWAESVRVPFLLRYPRKLGRQGRRYAAMLNTPDIMPTLLGLAGAPIPATVEGDDLSHALAAGNAPEKDAALIMCPAPFGQWTRDRGGREYRGVCTSRYTYTRSLDGPWLLYDNEKDPYQLENLCGQPEMAEVQAQLDAELDRKLEQTSDPFLPAPALIEQHGITVDKTGTVPYR